MSSLASENSVEAAEWFAKGISAMDARDWSNAVQCLHSAVRMDPASLKHREQKHRSCRRKFEKISKNKISAMNRVKLLAILARVRTAAARSDWNALDQLAEDALAIDPWNGQMYAHIAEAATHTDRLEVAKYAWKSAVKIEPNNAEWFESFGAVLEADGELETAKNCYQKVIAIDPTNRAAETRLRELDVSEHFDQNRGRRFRKPNPVTEPQPEPEPEQDPKVVAFVTLALDHAQRSDYQNALEAFRQALQIAPDDQSIQKQMEDTEIAHLRLQALQAQDAARKNPKSRQSRRAASQLVTQLNDREEEILTQRAAANPNDLSHMFRLAECYRRAGNYEKAISTFQRASGNSRLQLKCRLGIGECAVRLVQLELGRKQLEAVLEQIDQTEEPKTFKYAHYWLGRLYEIRREYATAVEHYGTITDMDAGFRDVRKRVKVLYELTWP